MEGLIKDVPGYIRAKKIVEGFENERFKEIVKPFICACCQKEWVTPDFGYIHNPDPTKQDEGVNWDKGTVVKLQPGYGSSHDTSSYFIAVCDPCMTSLLERGFSKSIEGVRQRYNESNSIKNEHGRIYSREIPEYADLMTVDEWNQSVEDGSFINDDGHGYWVKDGLQSRDEVFGTPPQDATHVAWYNK